MPRGKGRIAKSPEQHKTQGTFKQSRHGNRPENVERMDFEQIPAELSGDAREAWNRVKLNAPWCGKQDRDFIMSYCFAWAALCRVYARWERGGKDAPQLLEVTRAAEWHRKLGVELGIGPVNRTKVKVSDTPRSADPTKLRILALTGGNGGA